MIATGRYDPRTAGDNLICNIKDNRILAVAGMNRDRDLANWEEMIRQDRITSPRQLSTDAADTTGELIRFGEFFGS